MFLNIQHPGSGSPRNGSKPRQFSNWPDFNPAGRPRSSTVVVRRVDGGVIGA
jgi:secreted PhoX family phosphatase